MSRALRDERYESLYCEFHDHLEEDWRCPLMEHPFDYSEEMYSYLHFVTVERKIIGHE